MQINLNPTSEKGASLCCQSSKGDPRRLSVDIIGPSLAFSGWYVTFFVARVIEGAIGSGDTSDHTVRGRAALNMHRAGWPACRAWVSDPMACYRARRPPWRAGCRNALGTGGGFSTGAGPWSFTAGLPGGSLTVSASTR